jgi:hypothetical protein
VVRSVRSVISVRLATVALAAQQAVHPGCRLEAPLRDQAGQRVVEAGAVVLLADAAEADEDVLGVCRQLWGLARPQLGQRRWPRLAPGATATAAGDG